MNIEEFSFGAIQIDGVRYADDLVIERGHVFIRDKASSRKYRAQFCHTPLSIDEWIPWNCERLIVGTGVDGKLPVLPEVVAEATRRGVELCLLPTERAVEELQKTAPSLTNAILHLTC